MDREPFADSTVARVLSFCFGLGMAVFSVITIQHFFAANYPLSIYEGSVCDINAFFNCDGSAHSFISQLFGVPLGYFGLVVGVLVCLGAAFPSPDFERTNRFLSLLNVAGVIALLLISVFYLGSLCLYCTGFYIFSFLSLWVYWARGAGDGATGLGRFFRPSVAHLTAYAVVTLIGAYGFAEYHQTRKQAQAGGVATRVVREFYTLPRVELPSFMSPLWSIRSTENFEDAPIRIVEYVDLLCSDCEFLAAQMRELEEEFAGQVNVVSQLFPLEGACNDVVDKDKHPGACELSYYAARDSSLFRAIHDEVFADMNAFKDPDRRLELARRYGVEDAPQDSATVALVRRMMATGREYARTHDEYEHGIRSTPTMIINGRMVIGTLPYEQLRAIFQALVDEHERGDAAFIENWED